MGGRYWLKKWLETTCRAASVRTGCGHFLSIVGALVVVLVVGHGGGGVGGAKGSRWCGVC